MNKTNWQNETDKVIKGANAKMRLLLHACCAPCSSASLEYLSEFFEIDVLFYNPNISSVSEFQKRLDELERFVSEYPFIRKIKVIPVEYNHSEFLQKIKGTEFAKEGGERCERCFELRLEKTKEYAKEHGYDYYATTLTISPLKNVDVLNRIGLSYQDEQIKYLPTDLKKKGRYLRSIELSKEYRLYRQDFCGCEFSFAERQNQKRQEQNKTKND